VKVAVCKWLQMQQADCYSDGILNWCQDARICSRNFTKI
jgi:hypothetical protein